MIYNAALNEIPLSATPLNDYKKVCGSCRIYIVLFVTFLAIRTVVSAVFVYFYWYSKKDNVRVKFNPSTQTTIY